jgi:hypothetical protein
MNFSVVSWLQISNGIDIVGLCGNKEDHLPHVHRSTTLGVFICHADQSQRLPWRLEREAKERSQRNL